MSLVVMSPGFAAVLKKQTEAKQKQKQRRYDSIQG
jgi:hypothetical protein